MRRFWARRHQFSTITLDPVRNIAIIRYVILLQKRGGKYKISNGVDEDWQINYLSKWYGNKLNEKCDDSAGAGVYPPPSGSQFFAKQSI